MGSIEKTTSFVIGPCYHEGGKGLLRRSEEKIKISSRPQEVRRKRMEREPFPRGRRRSSWSGRGGGERPGGAVPQELDHQAVQVQLFLRLERK